MIQRKSSLVFLSMFFQISKSHFLTEGLNFSIPCKKLDYVDYLVNFELSSKDERNLDILSN